MGGRTDYPDLTNQLALGFAEYVEPVEEHFDEIIDQTVPTASALPASGNWLSRKIMAEDTGLVWIWLVGWKMWQSTSPISYTPTVTGFTGTAPTLAFTYTVAAGVIEIEGMATIVAGTVVGTGPTFSTPFAINASYGADADLGATTVRNGITRISAVTVKNGSNPNQLQVYPYGASGLFSALSQITSGNPGTWVAGNFIHVRARYVPA